MVYCKSSCIVHLCMTYIVTEILMVEVAYDILCLPTTSGGCGDQSD